MSVDNVVSADLVTADGELVVASEERNGDLFWALRGSGANFGIVTSIEFELHPIGGQGNPITESISVHPGDVISLRIPPS